MQQEHSQRKSQHIAVGRAIEDAKLAKAQTQELTSLLEEQGALKLAQYFLHDDGVYRCL